MRFRSVARRAALSIPQIRRFYDYSQQQALENAERSVALAMLQNSLTEHRADQLTAASEREALERQLASEREALERQLASEREALERQLTSEREALELQLYVMRSDYQRAVTRNEALSATLRECEARTAQTTRDAERHASLVSEMLAAERTREIIGPADLNLVYAKIAGRLTMLSSELAQFRPMRTESGGAQRYLDLLERALTGTLLGDTPISSWSQGYDPEIRAIGRDWPGSAQTMIGTARLRNLRVLVEQALHEGIPGDMLEAGVWRGGACILMRGVLTAHGVSDRTIWVADSFAGLPPSDSAYPADAGDIHATYDVLAVSLEEVQANFERYDLLDAQVRFLKGWFADTLPSAPIERLAILRLDGDMYSSTIQTLEALYSKVSPGGFVIVDDYILAGCRQATDDFRARHGIDEPMHDVDGAAVFWRKR